MRLRRSELSTPGSSKKMLAKAAASEADFVFCDLEDSVAPSDKEAARTIVADALTNHDWGRKTRAVRINGTHTQWWQDDIAQIVERAGGCLEVIIVPKVRTIGDVAAVDAVLDRYDAGVGLEVLIEEAEGLVNVEEIARSSPRVEALIFGPGDFSASQGVRWSIARQAQYPGDVWQYHRSRIVVAARAAEREAVDGPFANFRDAEGYRQEALRAALIGYAGKWAIHPSQIEIANEVFTPTTDEVRAAKELVDSYGDGAAAGVGGVMVDAATVRIMEGILERDRLIRAS